MSQGISVCEKCFIYFCKLIDDTRIYLEDAYFKISKIPCNGHINV